MEREIFQNTLPQPENFTPSDFASKNPEENSTQPPVAFIRQEVRRFVNTTFQSQPLPLQTMLRQAYMQAVKPSRIRLICKILKNQKAEIILAYVLLFCHARILTRLKTRIFRTDPLPSDLDLKRNLSFGYDEIGVLDAIQVKRIVSRLRKTEPEGLNILLMNVVVGLTQQEISMRNNLSIQTVRTLLNRAKKQARLFSTPTT